MSNSTSLARRVFSGSGQISLANGLARLVALLCFPLLSRWLGPAPYGVYSLAATVVGLASTVGLLCLDMAYARYYLEAQSPDQPAVEAFCWTRATSAAALCAVLAMLLWLGLSQRFAPLDRTSVAVFLPFAIVLSVLATMATTRVRLQARYGRMAAAVAAAAVAWSAAAGGAARRGPPFEPCQAPRADEAGALLCRDRPVVLVDLLVRSMVSGPEPK